MENLQRTNYKTAMLAKALGFDEETTSYFTSCKNHYCTEARNYDNDGYETTNWNNEQGSYPTKAEDVDCSAPTLTALQGWLMKKFMIRVLPTSKTSGYFGFEVYVPNKENPAGQPFNRISFFTLKFKDYDDALAKGLFEAMLIKYKELINKDYE